MFLEETIRRDKNLVNYALQLHEKAHIAADSFVIDVNAFVDNAKKIRQTTKQDLYFSLQHVGRNPVLARKLIKAGFQGCSAADFREAFTMMKKGVRICNVGHHTQIPKNMLYYVLKARPDYVTCYSLDKILEIEDVIEEAKKHFPEPKPGEEPFPKQKIMLKIVGENDSRFTGQKGGFRIEDLSDFPKFKNVVIAGITSFACATDDKSALNAETLKKAKEVLKRQGYTIENVNLSADNCCATIPQTKFADSLEISHALTGTHPFPNQQEAPCVLYLTEVSHNFDNNSYIYSCGHCKDGHIKNALVNDEIVPVQNSSAEDADYSLKLDGCYNVSTPVLLSFRPKMSATHSSIVLLEHGFIRGIFSPLGQKTKI